MNKFNELDYVRIIKLLLKAEDRANIGAKDIIRDPNIDETGTIVLVYPQIENQPNRYIVENCDNYGRPIWLADFIEEELEIIKKYSK